MAAKKVEIEYCNGWGYCAHFKCLSDDIRSKVPEVEVEGRFGRKSSFEVTLNGNLLFSKLKAGGFPPNKEIIEAIKNYDGKGEVTFITNTESSCILV